MSAAAPAVGPLGYDVFLSVADGRAQTLDDVEAMRTLVELAAAAGRSKIVETRAHAFETQGITVVAILAESHIALHTWPELGCLTLDMFTCSQQPARTLELVEQITEAVGGRLYAISQRPRHAPSPGPPAPLAAARQPDTIAPDEALAAPAPWCPSCAGARVGFDELAGWLVAVANGRPSRERSLGQNPVTHATNARRAMYIRASGDDRGDVLVIGDDDATSVAIAAISSCRSLTVLDYDPRVIEYLTAVSQRHDLGIAARWCDVVAGVPADLVASADCVVCDPIPTAEGMRLFFDFARKVLRPPGVLYTSAVPTDAPNLAEFHREAQDAGFLVSDMVPGFSDYPGDLDIGGDGRAATLRAAHEVPIEFSETWIRLVRADGSRP